MMLAAMLAGACCCWCRRCCASRLGVDEVVTTLLLNFIVLLFVSMMLDGPMKDPTGDGLAAERGAVGRAAAGQAHRAHARAHGLLWAVALAVGLWALLKYSTFGFAVRAVGANARGAGVRRRAGAAHDDRWWRCCPARSQGSRAPSRWPDAASYVTLDMSPGYGYTGIVIAMLAALNPLGVIAAAVFVAGVLVGADSMSRGVAVPTYIADVIVAISLLSMLVATAVRALPAALEALHARRHRRPCSATPTSGSAVLRIATPLILGTLGVLLCERAGVLNLGIEGIMVAGAFTGWLVVYLGAGLWIGVLVAALTGAAFGLLHALAHGAARVVAARARASASRCSPRRCRITRTA